MLGSPNGALFVYDGDGSVFGDDHPPRWDKIEKVFLDYFAASNQRVEATSFDAGSDYDAFRDAGIPAGGLFSGDIRKKDHR